MSALQSVATARAVDDYAALDRLLTARHSWSASQKKGQTG
jgi:hypothetical protein